MARDVDIDVDISHTLSLLSISAYFDDSLILARTKIENVMKFYVILSLKQSCSALTLKSRDALILSPAVEKIQ